MQIDRGTRTSPKIGDMAAPAPSACLGCETCEALCSALVEALTVPALVLREFDA